MSPQYLQQLNAPVNHCLTFTRLH